MGGEAIDSMTSVTAAMGGGKKEAGEVHAIALVSLAHFTNHFQNLVLPPLFPLLKAKLGIGFVELGFALTVANLLSVAAQLPVGFLVDRIGSRRMLIAGLLLAGLAFIGFGLSPTYPHLLLAMVFIGLSNSTFHPADYAILSAVVPAERVGRAFSIQFRAWPGDRRGRLDRVVCRRAAAAVAQPRRQRAAFGGRAFGGPSGRAHIDPDADD